MKLNDNAISHIAKLIQVAILTGTDIVDNLRMAEFVDNNGELDVTPEYHENFNNNIQKMLEQVEEQQASPEE
tara:strand:+ start:832 stop:1047 length:216 start_codon:yes stop_codon:yes gene_type:complete